MSPRAPESPFSEKSPRLQLAWDSTSLRALMFCPRYYELTILEGWPDDSIHFDFGIKVHSALEAGDRVRARGGNRDEAQMASLKEALELSGTRAGDGTWTPWGGEYMELWRCTHDPGPGKKKCEWAKAGRWFPAPGPEVCGDCESPTETKIRWLDLDKKKTRLNLLRAAVWYWEEQPENASDGIQPFVFPNGTVAVELPFRIPLGIKASTGEEFWLCGYNDGIVSFGPERFTRERKTTGSSVGRKYFAGKSPDVQIDTYDLAGSVLYPDLEIEGVMLEVCQTLQSGVRFSRQELPRTETQRQEWLTELSAFWLPLADSFARTGRWPMNRANCWNCTFNGICSKDPGKREMFLKGNFERRHWNPLEER